MYIINVLFTESCRSMRGAEPARDVDTGAAERLISMLICSDLCPDRQSGKSGGDPDARAHEIRKRRQEARILARQAVP